MTTAFGVLTSLSIDQILRVPADEPERVFDQTDLRGQYRTWLKMWWPKVNGVDRDAEAAFIRIQDLYFAAKARAQDGSWRTPGRRSLIDAVGKHHDIRFRVRLAFELGDVLVADEGVNYLIDPMHRALYDRARQTISSFPFADNRMRRTFAHLLPRETGAFESVSKAESGRLVLSLHKPAEFLSLADVLAHFSGRIDPRHAAWILSRLLNLACWMQFAGIAHGAISPETVFLSPRGHAVALLGGWWYATRYRMPLMALPASTAALLPSDVLRAKSGDPRIDLTLIRDLARTLFDDRGTTPRAGLHPALGSWLRLSSAGDAVAEYRQWERLRALTIGPSKFTAFALAADDVYPAAPPL